MKLNKSLFVATLVAFAVTGCGSVAPMLSTNPVNIDKRPLKTTPIKESDLQRWSQLDIDKDTIPGMSVDRAYKELLKGRKAAPIIVGVIDSGLDIDHPDLKGKIWTNKNEIAGNNKDDDNNGYIDDIHGWNFLGDTNNEQLELTRIVKKGNTNLPEYAKAKAELDKKLAEIAPQKQQVDYIFAQHNMIQKHLKKDNYTAAELNAIKTTDKELLQAQQVMQSVIAQTSPDFQSDLNDFKNQVYDMMNYNLNVDFKGRKTGDNPENINDKKYGNNNVKGLDVENALHGTHVAGIIAQIRDNKIGGDGVVAANITIMACRAVPNGDEYDKDIALAIRYAVDNGAKVINGSFGKDYSPHKEWVWDAIKYAASKDVLIVHAAGNDGKDVDIEENFPCDTMDKTNEISDNFLSIGALNTNYGAVMVADFSNYGSKNVDIFSPGMKIYATVPNGKYKYEQGTSMASPNAAGVAALIRSYYPKLTAAQVKQIIMDSGTAITIPVVVGETKDNRPFANICKSGKIINAYNAIIMADKLSVKK
jgi:subtilisin family serine protease